MKIDIKHQHLHLPVKNKAGKVVFELHVDGKLVRDFDIELALDAKPDWWTCYDVSEFKGKTIELKARGPMGERAEAKLAELVDQSDALKDADDLYAEMCRPQFHFTPRRGWNNDPNGMVYYDGEYHLFFQHNPFGIGWGNMHWGHAVSRDLAHWEELPIALFQHGLKDMAYSGSGAVDEANTAGFKTGDEDAIVLAFTSTGRGECIAYSNDRGRTLTEFNGNPVLEHRGRDPKVVWLEPQQKWVMVVYDESEGQGRYAFYESNDLKTWSFTSAVQGFYECPEFFCLPLDGDAARRKWVLYGAERRDKDGQHYVARSSYMVGAFDGRAFSPQTRIVDGHLGPNYYAAQTFGNAPNGRRIMMGWLSGATYPVMPFSQGFTVPLELSLRTTPDGPRLFFYPVKELDALRGERWSGEGMTVEQANAILAKASTELLDIEAEIEPCGADVELHVRGVKVAYRAADRTLCFGDKTAKLARADGKIRLRVLVDRCVIEVFGNDGLAAFSAGGGIFSASDEPISLSGAAAKVDSLSAFEIKSMWC